MAIIFKKGDILESEADAIVNAVNCEGVMGKGLAYQFKKKYNENFLKYEEAVTNRQIYIGKSFLYKEKDKFIINFPTKNKWREKSKIEYIEKGLDDLILQIKENNIKSVAIPPLGVGNGGLNWNIVKDLILEKFSKIQDNIDVIIYEPIVSLNNKISKKNEKYKFDYLDLFIIDCYRNIPSIEDKNIIYAYYFLDLLTKSNKKINDIIFFQGDIKIYNYELQIIQDKIMYIKNMNCNINDFNDLYCSIYNRIIKKELSNKIEKNKKYMDYIYKLVKVEEQNLKYVLIILIILKENNKFYKSKIENLSYNLINKILYNELENEEEINNLVKYTQFLIEKNKLNFNMNTLNEVIDMLIAKKILNSENQISENNLNKIEQVISFNCIENKKN